jgi:type II secretory pathway pseudopilin PulG
LTLIELLVVITIIGLLLALLIPAVMAAKRAAIKSQCANNLRQIGIAIHQHAQSHGTFPAGVGKRAKESYLVQILPYLEQGTLYGSINFEINRSVLNNENVTAMSLIPGIYLCPADTSRPLHMNRAFNYPGNAGKDFSDSDAVFVWKPLAERDILDGLSQTVGVAEWVTGSGFIDPGYDPDQPERLRHRFGLRRHYSDHPEDFAAFLSTCKALDRNEVNIWTYAVPKGHSWMSRGLGHSLYNHLLAPNQPSCFAIPNLDAVTAGSLHAGGAHALTMDGSVQFIKESIDTRLWSAVGTRGGGEPVGSLTD